MSPSSSPRIEARAWISEGARTPYAFVGIQNGVAQLCGQPNAFVGHRMWVPGDRRPRGLFAEWSWDGESLRAEVDPLGYFSLFVYARGNEIGVSPSILQLIAHGADPAPDRLALAVFHRIGFFVETDTPFAHIHTLPPGARLTWVRGVLKIENHHPAPAQTPDLTREQAVEAFIEIPRASIRCFLQQWDGPVALPLSGGRDSRHIFLEMLRQGRKPDTCITFHHGGRAFNNEVQAARALTARARVRHLLLGQPRRRLRDAIRALLINQLCSDEHAQMMPMHDFFCEQAMASIDGIGGDILTTPDDQAADYMNRSRRGDYGGIARNLAAGHARVISRPAHAGGAGALYSPELEDAAIDRIAAALRYYEDWPDPYQAFWFWNRTRREISFVSAAIMGGAATVFCPYLDPAMVETGLSLPWSITKDQQLHDDAIHRAFPEYADIPYAASFPSQLPPFIRRGRVTNLLDSVRVAAMARPASARRALLELFVSDGLQRAHANIYQLHAAFIDSMDRSEAKRLIALDEKLRKCATKGLDMVTDVFSND